MKTLLGSLLGIIAVGVLLIAYGLLGPRAGAVTTIDADQSARAAPVAVRAIGADDLSIAAGAGIPSAAASGLQLRCEPGQRAVISSVGGATAAECVGAAIAGGYTMTPAALTYPVSEARQFRPAVATAAARPRVRTASVARRPKRDWQQTAMVIGGSGAAGAGLGAIFGGKKGALIGAAIGGGAGTLFEVKKR
ncbi:MAG: hypothetical protein ABI868_14990 [Acidobacteriota bacterium]